MDVLGWALPRKSLQFFRLHRPDNQIGKTLSLKHLTLFMRPQHQISKTLSLKHLTLFMRPQHQISKTLSLKHLTLFMRPQHQISKTLSLKLLTLFARPLNLRQHSPPSSVSQRLLSPRKLTVGSHLSTRTRTDSHRNHNAHHTQTYLPNFLPSSIQMTVWPRVL
jgi:hypothetical protein